ncbi:MAG: T9SS type A sorting domain-containing protein [Saprospiraceae bacterium]|nr:T9SS type A sorting domain-containing protein [Saprospiraceae bacterium]
MKTYLLTLPFLFLAVFGVAQANDDCANATVLTFDVDNLISASFNDNDYSYSGVNPTCEGGSPEDAWYSFVMPFNGNIYVQASSSSSTEYAIYDACGGNEEGCISRGAHVFSLLSGQTYYLQVFRTTGTSGNVTFTIEAVPEIMNDDCANAEALPAFDMDNITSATFNTSGATPSGVSPSCEAGSPRDGWYSFVMPFDGNIYYQARSSSSSEIAIYDACGGTEVGCISRGAHVFSLTGGQTYYVQAFRTTGTDGQMTFNIEAVPEITNDDCASAEALPAFDMDNVTSATFNTSGATPSGVSPSCETGSPRDGWYSFVMPFDGNIYYQANSSSSSEIAIYDACGGTEVGCISRGAHVFSLTGGQTYYVQAFRTTGTDGNMTFNIEAVPEITNDDCASAEALPAFDGANVTSATFNTSGATPSGINPSCESGNQRDGWYSFVMPFDGNIYYQTSSSSNAEISVYDACGGAEVGCISRGAHVFNLVGGQTYFLQAFRSTGTDGVMTFIIEAVPAITNDDCASAEALPAFDGASVTSATFNTSGATPSGVSPSCESGNQRDGWYSFVMPFDGNIYYQTSSSSNAEISVYDACGGAEVGCVSRGAHIFNLVGGQTYFVQAFRSTGTDGVMTFNIEAVPAITNDDCASAESIVFDMNNEASLTFNTSGATPSGVSPSCESGNPRDGWYSFISPISGSYAITSSGNTEYAVYDACGGNELACGKDITVSNIVDGQEYFIQAYRTFGTDGEMTFTLTPTITPISDGTVGLCETIPSITIDGASGNNMEWVQFVDSAGELVAAINANGSDLGQVDMELYIDAMDTRTFNAAPYLRRTVNISPEFQPIDISVDVRIYILEDEFNDLAAADDNISSIDDLSLIKQSGAACADGLDGLGEFFTVSSAAYRMVDYTIEASINSFSTFTGGSFTSLPVELTAFDGVATDAGNALSWSTASEENTEAFIVERSTTGLGQWQEIGRVAAVGFSAVAQSYEFVDVAPSLSAYYRLQIVDFDGYTEYSDIIFIEQETLAELRVWPNPARDVLSVAGSVSEVEVLDVRGRVLITSNDAQNIDVSSLPRGLYFLRIDGQTLKFVKE